MPEPATESTAEETAAVPSLLEQFKQSLSQANALDESVSVSRNKN